jgi:hypothetical protein
MPSMRRTERHSETAALRECVSQWDRQSNRNRNGVRLKNRAPFAGVRLA